MSSKRIGGCLVLCVVVSSVGAVRTSTATLTFEQRVEAQRAIERVYHSHLSGTPLPFEQAVPTDLLERKVRTYLKQSLALERIWGAPLTARMLRAEAERMTRESRLPGRLRELHAALGNDPILIQECLVRPLLADRLARHAFAFDATLHQGAREGAEDLRSQLISGAIDARREHPQRFLRDGAAGTREEMASALPSAAAVAAAAPPASSIGPVIETAESFGVEAALTADPARRVTALFVSPKITWDEWWSEVEAGLDARDAALVATDASPLPAAAVGAGSSEWMSGGPAVGLTGLCIADDVWVATSQTGAPTPREGHSAIWTGSQMIVWGGFSTMGLSGSGGRYDPATDTWLATSTTNAPPGSSTVSVWTGSLMIVWGGAQVNPDVVDTGGSYDPIADKWKPTSMQGAPSARTYHTAVWADGVMVVWGGRDGSVRQLADGARYDPVADTWSPTSAAPLSPRQQQTAVWTGSRMVLWGGACYSQALGCLNNFYEDGAQYDPVGDTWGPTTLVGASSQRVVHTAVWTGNLMLIYGGSGPFPSQGVGRYDPASNTWLSLGVAPNEPDSREGHTAVWTGQRMVVWGGGAGLVRYNTGGRYDPAANQWKPTSMTGVPSIRNEYSAVGADGVMIIWGGLDRALDGLTDTGGMYGVGGAIDGDGDGFASSCDCDDESAVTYPGAPEACDGLDNDCDGIVPASEIDDDGDEFAECDGDCDDTDSFSSPGAPEVCDARDNDCDGVVPPSELDGDGDGFPVCRDDCDDHKAAVHPGAVDLPGNTLDEDCDGSLGPCDPRATWTGHGTFVNCVIDECDRLVSEGLVSEAQCSTAVAAAARSRVGHQGIVSPR